MVPLSLRQEIMVSKTSVAICECEENRKFVSKVMLHVMLFALYAMGIG